jgi:RIO kinase 1
MLHRDVNNMTEYYGQFAPELLETRYADEIWALYEEGELTENTELTGLFEDSGEAADVDSVLLEIKAVMEEEAERRERIREANEDD